MKNKIILLIIVLSLLGCGRSEIDYKGELKGKIKRLKKVSVDSLRDSFVRLEISHFHSDSNFLSGGTTSGTKVGHDTYLYIRNIANERYSSEYDYLSFAVQPSSNWNGAIEMNNILIENTAPYLIKKGWEEIKSNAHHRLYRRLK